jgi:hypothetical protein
MPLRMQSMILDKFGLARVMMPGSVPNGYGKCSYVTHHKHTNTQTTTTQTNTFTDTTVQYMRYS